MATKMNWTEMTDIKRSKKRKKNVDSMVQLWDIALTHGKHKLQKHMRTKTLLCLAALAAGAATSMAQSNVYSLNVVGYINITVPANQYVMIANQLNSTNNTIGSVLGAAQDGSLFQKFNNGYSAYVYDALVPGWTPDGNATLNPGEGGFFKSPVATTITFVGEVLQGSLTNTLPLGQYVVRSSEVPQAGTPTTLAIPGEDGDILQTYHGSYSAFVYDALAPGWTPTDPNLAVGESFFYKKASTSTQPLWIRNFTVQ